MAEAKQALTEPEYLRKHLQELEETQRATLNILDDFDEEKAKLTQLQQAALNLLEDFDEERHRYQLIQKATLNLLEDVSEDRNRLDETQRALMNMLEDFEVERAKAEQARALLESVGKELEAFSYSVSHDLRAPLRAIDGFSNALRKQLGDQLGERGEDYMRRIRAAAQRMGELIDDLLDLSRAARAEVKRERFDLSAMVREITEEFQSSQPERKAEFAIQPDVLVNADPQLMQIAMRNLLDNAWKFTSPREVARIEFGVYKQDGEQVYYVSDNGVGFDPAYVGKLFTPFQRLHAEAEFPGTGIGLALVQRIIRKHGGRIWAEGAVDKGAKFSFTLG